MERIEVLQSHVPSQAAARAPSWTTHLRTDGRGVIVSVEPEAARWLRMPTQRLMGKPLLHFVARKHTRAFRGLVKGLGYPHALSIASLCMRPRHGSPAEVSASVARVAPNNYEWTLEVFSAPPKAPPDATRHERPSHDARRTERLARSCSAR